MGDKLAVQMFTLREHTGSASELAQSLKRVSDIGYQAVQLSAVKCMGGENPPVSAKEARRMLDDNGLKCIATHRSLDSLLNNTDAEIEFHKTLSCDYTAIGGISGDRQTAAGYRDFLKTTAPMIEKLKAAGIRFGHHNHSKEFIKTEEGNWPADILIDEGGSDLMLELDLYWVEHAGLNCVRLLERCHDRVPVIHLKDKAVVPEDGPVMAPIGEGNMDWDHIIPACEEAGVQWYAVEQDVCRRDPFDCLKSSFEYLSAKGL